MIKNSQRGEGGIEAILGLIVILLLVVTFIARFSGSDSGYSQGARAGVLQKLSVKGIATKTWEGELALDGISTGKNGNAGVWAFSVHDPKLAEEMQKNFLGKRVRVSYKESVTNRGWHGTNYNVISMEEVK